MKQRHLIQISVIELDLGERVLTEMSGETVYTVGGKHNSRSHNDYWSAGDE